MSRGLPSLFRISHAQLVTHTMSSSRVGIPQRFGKWQRFARYATTTTGEGNSGNSESLLSADQVFAEELPKEEPTMTTPSNGTNGNDGVIPEALGDGSSTDWSKSYFGLSSQPFSKEISEVLGSPIDPLDIEIKPGALSSIRHPLTILTIRRWTHLPSRNQVSTYFKQVVWSWRVGSCSPE